MRGFSCWPHPCLSPKGSHDGMSPLRSTLLIALAFLIGVAATVAATDVLAPRPPARIEPIRLSPPEAEETDRQDRKPRKRPTKQARPQREETRPAPAPAAPAPAPAEDPDDGAPVAPGPPPARAGDDEGDDDDGGGDDTDDSGGTDD